MKSSGMPEAKTAKMKLHYGQIELHCYRSADRRICCLRSINRRRRQRRDFAGRLCKASIQEKEKDDVLDGLDNEQFAFKKPKFQAFIGQSEKGQQLRAFRQIERLEEGHLLIQPLRQEHLSAATDLLTVTFADAIGYMPMYRGYLKRQVKQYLNSHINITPKAIILEVVFVNGGCDSRHMIPEPDEMSDAILSRSSDSVSWLDNYTASSPGDSFPNNIAQDAGKPAEDPFQPSPPAALGETLMGSVDRLLDGDPEQPELDTDYSRREGVDGPEQRDEAEGVMGRSEAADEGSELVGDSIDSNSLDAEEDVSGPEGPSDSDSQPEAERLPDGNHHEPYQGQLIGTVELSFTSSTRSKSLTLNPPEDGVYLCNMAVDENHKRKGYGMRMLAAAEALVQVAGGRRIWLHVRLKDEPALGLYSKAGYEVEKEDCILVGLWDDRRRLLSKFIPRKKELMDMQPEESNENKEAFVAEY